MAESSEQNKTEEATPYKLKRAREKGQVARGIDLGFFSMLFAFSLAVSAGGPGAVERFTHALVRALRAAGADVEPAIAARRTMDIMAPHLTPVFVLAGVIAGVVILLELVQVRGLYFSTAPLKPDFNRLNPAQGFKRVFSIRTVKETLKNITKLAAYAAATAWVGWEAFGGHALVNGDAQSLVTALWREGGRLIFVFALIAFAFALLDQVLARGEFAKQMRMSRRDLQREHKDREGEPRLKQKRRQLHAEFARQAQGFSDLGGADLVVVNPDHYAVALRYDAATMAAPRVVTKGRNHFALALKQRAAQLSVPIFHHPPLARGLFKSCERGEETPSRFYRDLAGLYLALKRNKTWERAHVDA